MSYNPIKVSRYICVILLSFILTISLCACDSTSLSQWNPDGNINDIETYVEDVCNAKSENYIPEENRIVTLDMDGTIIPERDSDGNDCYVEVLMSEYFADTFCRDDSEVQTAKNDFLKAEKNFNSDPDNPENYLDYDSTFHDLLGSEYEGLNPEEVKSRLLYLTDKPYDNTRTISEIGYSPMIELCHYLMDNDFKIYFVSASNRYVVYSVLSTILNDSKHTITFDNCIGMNYNCEYSSEDGDEEVCFSSIQYDSSDDFNKCRLIVQEIGNSPVMSIGNSSGDSMMLNFALSNPDYRSMSVIINHDDPEREHQYNARKMKKLSEENSWLCISMKHDFKSIYQ